MEVQAKARFIRQSPRKVRLVVDLIRGLGVAAAQDQLRLLPKRAAATVLKVLNSAIANAKQTRQLAENNLFVARAFVDQGPTIKRFAPKAFGRAGAIRKRTSHITIVLADKKIKDDKRNSKSETLNSKQITNSNTPNKEKISV